MSPPPWSTQPLVWLTCRVGSRSPTRRAIALASNWPQPSLNGVQTATRGDVAQQLDGGAHLAAELLASGGVASLVEPVQPVGDPDRVARRAVGGQVAVAAAAVDDVLPDQHADPVAVGVPAQRLDLRVLAQHREAERLHRLDVVDHRLVAGRGDQPVGPVPLVEHADVRDGSPLSSSRALPCSSRPTPNERSAAYDVTRSSPEGHLEVVEVRVARATMGARRTAGSGPGRRRETWPRRRGSPSLNTLTSHGG